VTILQRSPSYVVSMPAVDPVAGLLGRLLPPKLAYRIVRWKNTAFVVMLYRLSRRRPGAVKWAIRRLAERQLPAGYDYDTHLSPSYDPWDQRMCIVPDGDLFDAIRTGRVSIVTDRIDTFTAEGIALESGAVLEADLVVTATGLELLPFGGIRLGVDGSAVSLPETLAYRGMLLSGVPNLAYAFGYINQSWTLGSDLTCEHVCRLLNHMDRHGYAQCTPRRPEHAVGSTPFFELSSGYVLRANDRFPQQASSDPWRREPNYLRNRRSMRRAPLVDDPALEFSSHTVLKASQLPQGRIEPSSRAGPSAAHASP
jgi:cation diffusion facilitator CzcD-associated flavoprotein CzcO